MFPTSTRQSVPIDAAQPRFPPPIPSARDDAQRNALVLELLPLVRRIALRIWKRLPHHIEIDDLVEAGALGLLDAVRRFDGQKGVKIERYAEHRISGAILDFLRDLDGASRCMRSKGRKVENAYRNLVAKLGRAATDEEMAQALGISLQQWHRAVGDLQALGVGALRAIVPMGTDLPGIEDLRADNQEDEFVQCYRREQREILERALARIGRRKRLIIRLYYTDELNMKEIAARLGVSESRVSQLHSDALRQLRSDVRVLAGLREEPLRLPSRSGSTVLTVYMTEPPGVQSDLAYRHS